MYNESLLFLGSAACEGGIKKTEAQFHLQRKLQEKELIKEQKRKLQEQRSNILSVNKTKSLPSKKRVVKSRKTRFSPDDMTCVSFCWYYFSCKINILCVYIQCVSKRL